MEIIQTRNERWWSDGQGYFTIFYFRKKIHIFNYDAHDAIKNTDTDWSQSRFGMRHTYIGQRLVTKV